MHSYQLYMYKMSNILVNCQFTKASSDFVCLYDSVYVAKIT